MTCWDTFLSFRFFNQRRVAKKSEITANKKVEEKTFQSFRLFKKGARRNKPPFKKKAGDIYVASDEVFMANISYIPVSKKAGRLIQDIQLTLT